MPIVYIGVGSNLGNREDNIKKAFGFLEDYNIHILKTSTLIETDPIGGPPQGKFLNGVLKVETMFSPKGLLRILKAIEKKLGRRKALRNAPRPIDLDILLYDQLTLDTISLTIPHPRMLERSFVLTPLTEIFPDWKAHFPHACC